MVSANVISNHELGRTGKYGTDVCLSGKFTRCEITLGERGVTGHFANQPAWSSVSVMHIYLLPKQGCWVFQKLLFCLEGCIVVKTYCALLVSSCGIDCGLDCVPGSTAPRENKHISVWMSFPQCFVPP